MIDLLSDALEKLRITRRIGYFFTLYLTFYAFRWTTEFVYNALGTNLEAVEIAAIIAAVLVPVTGLQTAVISFYHKDRPAYVPPTQLETPSYSRSVHDTERGQLQTGRTYD